GVLGGVEDVGACRVRRQVDRLGGGGRVAELVLLLHRDRTQRCLVRGRPRHCPGGEHQLAHRRWGDGHGLRRRRRPGGSGGVAGGDGVRVAGGGGQLRRAGGGDSLGGQRRRGAGR